MRQILSLTQRTRPPGNTQLRAISSTFKNGTTRSL